MGYVTVKTKQQLESELEWMIWNYQLENDCQIKIIEIEDKPGFNISVVIK